MNWRRVVSLSIACGASGIALAQQPARDAAVAPVFGTARVAGVVVGVDTPPEPIRRAILTIKGAELPGGRAAITDDAGRFEFDRLPAGRFTIVATKAAHLAASYGASRPGRAGVPLEVKDGERVANVVLTMARGAAIAGTVRDERGDPATIQQVAAFRSPRPGEPPILVSMGNTVTDDRGAYRIFGLPPGEYYVAATPRLGLGSAPTAGQIDAMSAAGMDAALRELQQRAGAALPVPPAQTPAAGSPSTLAPGAYALAPVYFPGVSRVSDATAISLSIGEERLGVDLVMRLVPVVSIEGSVVSAGGPLPSVQLIFNPDGVAMPSILNNVPSLATNRGDSTLAFKYSNVTPGRFTILARTGSAGVRSVPGGAAIGVGSGGPPVDPTTAIYWARAEVDVTGRDVTGVTLVLQPALRMSGRIVFDGTTLAPPEDASTVRLLMTLVGFLGMSSVNGTMMGSFSVPAASVEPSGRFQFVGILPGTYRVSATVASPSGWWLRSAMVNGVDILDVPLEFGDSGSVTDAVLTFSDRRASLSGRLVDAADRGAGAVFVAVFPVDRRQWLPQARRIRSARASTDGRWTIPDLPPGEYLVAALTDLDPDALFDPRFLGQLASAAAAVSLAEGEQKTFDLRIGR